ncbi:MAG TPA: hypothetical protein VMN60_02330 [Longimicrobiales bacterium]|nr:hypothetical protein [Longimicrobiales bacterium]
MTTHALRTPWLTAARAQFRLLWWSRRAMMLMMILIGTFIMLEVLMYVFRETLKVDTAGPTVTQSLLLEEMIGVVLLVAFGWGIAVWRGETAEQRAQMLTAPIDSSKHEFARVAAGAAWLLLGIAGFLLVGVTGAVVRGNAGSIAAVSWLTWVLFITGPLLAFSLSVPVATATPRAFEYITFSIIGFYLVVIVLVLRGYEDFVEAYLAPVFAGKYGIGAAFTPGIGMQGKTIGSWLLALVLWYALTAAALYGVLRWRRGRT